MIIQVGVTTGGDKKEFQGLSTDAKPVNVPGAGNVIGSGSTFYEVDTKKGFVFDANNINPVTGSGWWEV
jgi:hypothetical protein